MGLLDRLISGLTGRSSGRAGYQQYGQQPYQQPYGQGGYAQGGYQGQASYGSGPQDTRPGQRRSSDEEAIARYRYMLETAPPDKIEEAHAEAFAKLTPDQRRQVLSQLAQAGADPVQGDDPRSMARSATRLEMRRPGSLFSTFGGSGFGRPGMGGLGMGGLGMGGGMGMGGMLLTSVAGAFIGSAIADEMFDHDGFMDWDTGGHDQFADGGQFDDGGQQFADGGYDGGGDAGAGAFDTGFDGGGSDFGGADFGGLDGGDFGSDF